MENPGSAQAVALWAGLHMILLVVLSVLVVRQRRVNKVAFGDGGSPELAQAIRAFGNAAEYTPTGLVALAVLAMAGGPPLLLHVIGLALFGGRVAHALGLSRSSGTSTPRSVGILMTWSAYVAAAAALLFFAIP